MNIIKFLPIWILVFTIFACLYRAIKGPSNADRLIAINVIGTKTIVLMTMISVIVGKKFYEDVVIVYALLSYLATVVISKYVDEKRGHVE